MSNNHAGPEDTPLSGNEGEGQPEKRINDTPPPGTLMPENDTLNSKLSGRKTWRIVRHFILVLGLLLAAYIVYSIADIFISPGRSVRQIYLVPKDAVVIIQSSEPVADWHRLSKSGPWQSMANAPAFEEIGRQISSLDSMVNSNKTLLSLVGKRDITVSLHKTSSRNWDFLAIIDLQKVSKIKTLGDQIGQILKATGTHATDRTYNGVNIIEVHDRQTRSTLYMAFIDNHFTLTYDPLLIQASIDERNSPHIGMDRSFLEAERSAGTKGICRVFVNYAYLPQFLSIYLDERNGYIDMFSGSMEYAGLSLDVDRNMIQVKGYTIVRDEADPYIKALLSSGRNRMKAHEIFSSRTALYANIGFSSPSLFLKELEKAMKENDGEIYENYRSARDKLEKYFDISLEKNFLDWMSGEFALAQLAPGGLGQEPELILAIRANNIKSAQENMELIEKRIKRRSPVKIRNVEYKDYPINYIELKGVFRLFFGALFDSFEKPYYTYINDYVVFSNQSSALLSFIEDYRQDNLIANDPGFKTAFGRADRSSTAFVYADLPALLPLLRPKLQAETAAVLDDNRDALNSLPYWTLQISGDRMTSMKLTIDHDPEAIITEGSRVASATEPDDMNSADAAMDEDAQSEKELLSELRRFHLEKFEGNVMREFYPGGALKSEQEMRKGQRHGRFREYYENGALRVRGKYSNNKPKGTWKYYTPEGKFERKERY